MVIKVNDNNLGSCTIETINNIEKTNEYIIKSLACLQIMFMSEDPDQTRKNELINILNDAIHKCDKLFREENEQFDPTEQF